MTLNMEARQGDILQNPGKQSHAGARQLCPLPHSDVRGCCAQYELLIKIKQGNCNKKQESALIPSWDGDSETSQVHVTNTIGPDHGNNVLSYWHGFLWAACTQLTPSSSHTQLPLCAYWSWHLTYVSSPPEPDDSDTLGINIQCTWITLVLTTRLTNYPGSLLQLRMPGHICCVVMTEKRNHFPSCV